MSDYVDADTAAKGGGLERYRYECACCWEEVRLCAAYSKHQATHFRHRSGNNNVECENYLGNRSSIISNALSRRNARDNMEFYFSSANKLFSLAVRFSAEEIAEYEQGGTSFQVRSEPKAKPTISIPINGSRYLPDVFEPIPLCEFSWKYYVSLSNDTRQRKYEVFRKDSRGYPYPSFFRIQAEDDAGNYQAKLTRTETLYTNTPYLMVSIRPYHSLSSQNGVNIDKVIRFSTMNRDFTAVVVTFTQENKQIKQQLEVWKYRLESSETLTLLWPPSSQVNDSVTIKTGSAIIYSSFVLQAHGNTNAHSGDISKLEDGVSKISIAGRTKIYKKNAELVLSKNEDAVSIYDSIVVTRIISKNYTAQDINAYLFNRSGVLKLSKGTSLPLTTSSTVRHYSCGYLDCIITAPNITDKLLGTALINEILRYYKRTEEFDYTDFKKLDVSDEAFVYIKSCEKTGLINSAVKRYIREGRI